MLKESLAALETAVGSLAALRISAESLAAPGTETPPVPPMVSGSKPRPQQPLPYSQTLRLERIMD